MSHITRYLNDEGGAAAAEYALIIGLVAVLIVTALQALQGSVSGAITAAANFI